MAKVEISKFNIELTEQELKNILILIDKFKHNENDSRIEGSVFAVEIDDLEEDLIMARKYFKN